MLSVQPDLTTSEVRDILQKTATDLGPTGYDTTYGYGLLNAAAAVAEVALSINGSKISKSSGTFRIENLPKSATVNWSLDDDNKDNIKLTVSGDGNRECKAELIKPKTVKTNITATVKIGNLTLASMTKNIVLLGTFCGTYSVPATTINGVSLPAITNRPFTAGSTLEARAGQFIYITSDDLNYYSSSWSGNPIQNWTVGLNTIRFSYPATANSNTTILEFKGSVGGTVRVNVKPIGPPVSIKTAIEGNLLCVKIEEVQNDGEWEADDVSVMKCTKPVGGTWTIEVANTMTGTVQTAVTTSSGECQFTTSTWPAGIYLIKASDGTYTLSKKITIK